MPKRKRGNGGSTRQELISDSDDEIVVARPTQVGVTGDRQESDVEHVKDQFRAGTTAIANGIATPLTQEKNSQFFESSTEEAEDNAVGFNSWEDQKRLKGNAGLRSRILAPDVCGPAYPRSQYHGWTPPLEEVSEMKALAGLADAHRRTYLDTDDTPDYTYCSLNKFSIYRHAQTSGHRNELVTLDRLSKDRFQEFRFDGILSFGTYRRFVRNVPFSILTVDGYGDSEVTDMREQLCIQSSYAARHNAWYKLGTPAPEYKRFYQPFLWLARFTKYFVDYLLCTEGVTISHFGEAFFLWLQQRHQQEPEQDQEKEPGQDAPGSIHAWLREANLRDFRTTVAAHVEFLWKECYGTQQPSDEIMICEQPLWAEVHPARLTAIPDQPNLVQRTIVTPFAYDCFKSMYFADQFLETPIANLEVRRIVQNLKRRRGLTPISEPVVLTPISEAQVSAVAIPTRGSEISVGDVVMLPPEKEGKWKSSANCWYAYVQRIRTVRDGRSRLDVMWLYHASDTTIGACYYPFPNELFFSDNCGCDTKDDQEAWDLEEVIGKVDVSWSVSDPYQANEKGLFVRQKFRTVPDMGHYDFVTLQDSDFRCHHQPDSVDQEKEDSGAYALGDVVLVRVPNGYLCEIAQIIGGQGKHLRLRRLRRKRDFLPSARTNELILTSEVYDVTNTSSKNDADNEDEEEAQVVRRCHVKFFTREEIDSGRIPSPYDRDGAGDYFFLGAGTPDNNEAEKSSSDIETSFPSINQGWDPRTEPTDVPQQLTGLGIFCGGGTFDRGLEEGGAVKFRHAVEWAEHALHSYRANLRSPEEVKFFLGSVNDYLAKALSGDFTRVAHPGSIQLISAGSPCQGFSRMQLFTASEGSKQNASMVASVVAFADLYSPEYMILENVVSMTECRNERKEHNVFSQIIAALVGLGYQVQQFLIDSWSHGSSQQRPRLFIIATAPGLSPLPQPACSHAHPAYIKTRKLGTSSNGLPFGTRVVNPDVALPHVSPQEAAGDLPFVYDSQPQLCPAFPDHRTATDESDLSRTRIRAVPLRPRGMTLINAWEKGLLSGEPAHFCETRNPIRKATTSKMYARVLPEGLFPTFITSLSVADGMNGRCIHWDQHRVLTVMEAKRAQGYLDHEVLVGTAKQQMKIIGNSVDRKAALVLGLSLRESWMKSSTSAVVDEEMEDVVESTEIDTNEDQDGTHVDSSQVDNRSVKMALTLSKEDIEKVNKVTATTGRTFKEILRILSEKEEHRTARNSLHGS